MKVIALASFVHGVLDMKPGDEAEFSDATAAELKAAGLVRYPAKAAPSESDASGDSAKPVPHTAPAPANKKAPAPANKKAPEPKNKKAPEPENKGALPSLPDLGVETIATAPADEASQTPDEPKAPE